MPSVTICRLADLSDPGSHGFFVGEGDWPLRGFVVRKGDDVFAYVNRCPHAGHPLNRQPDEFLTPDRQHILCRSHLAMFDLRTGECVAGICAGRALQELPVRIEGERVILDVDPALDRFV